MLKIDIHTHIIPRNIPKYKGKFGYGGFIVAGKNGEGCGVGCEAELYKDDGQFFRKVKSNCWDPEARIEDFATSSLSVQVLSPLPAMFNYWAKPKDGLTTSQYINDSISETVSRHPKKFVGICTLPLQDGKLAAKELERSMKGLGHVGAEIGSHINGWNLDDENLYPFYEAAEDLGAAVFVHPWDMMGKDRMKKYWLPWLVGMPSELSLAISSVIFGGILDRFPKLKLAFAHGGGAFPQILGRLEHGHKVRPDLVAVDNSRSPLEYLGRFYVDSLVHDKYALETIIRLFGKERVALGSDYPFPLGEAHPGELISSMGYDTKTLERLFSGTALEWMGKVKEDFV